MYTGIKSLKHDTLTYRDPTRKNPVKRLIPTLNPLEQRMYNSIVRALKAHHPVSTRKEIRLKKVWLINKTRKRAKLLVGVGRYNPLSDDLSVSFEIKTVKL